MYLFVSVSTGFICKILDQRYFCGRNPNYYLALVLGHDEISTESLITAVFFLTLSFTPEEERAAKKIAVLDESSLEEKLYKGVSALLPSPSDDYGAVHCPYYPSHKFPSWWALLSTSKSQGLQCVPIRVNFIPATRDFSQDGAPLFPSLVIQFSAPSSPGSAAYSLDLKCDSLVGADFHLDIKVLSMYFYF